MKYDFVDGRYLYNRCHLIGYQLTGENANVRNLITGTRYMNVDGMLPFENMVADYIKETGNHVLYRVTPIFVGSELLARGVHMEAYSLEDKGDGIYFNVYCFNAQPGVKINYKNGDSSSENGTKTETTSQSVTQRETTTEASSSQQVQDYICNVNTKKFHKPSCSSVKQMNESNKSYRTCTRQSLINAGYSPCKNCNP